MNRKETLIWSIIDNVIIACDIPRADGTHSMTKRKTIEEIVIMTDMNMITKTEIENMVVVVMAGIN